MKIAQIGRDEIDEQGNKLPNICEPPQEAVLIPPSDFLREMLMHKGDCSFCTKLVKKELFDISGLAFPEGELNEDFHLLVQLLTWLEKGIVSLPQQTYHVFYRMGSNTRKKDPDAFSRVFGDNVNNADMAEGIVKDLKSSKGNIEQKISQLNKSMIEISARITELQSIAFRFGMYQRIEYLLHIPVSKMNGESKQYGEICKYVRRKCLKSWKNPYLTMKNNVYITLFAIAPKTIRVVHKKVKGL